MYSFFSFFNTEPVRLWTSNSMKIELTATTGKIKNLHFSHVQLYDPDLSVNTSCAIYADGMYLGRAVVVAVRHLTFNRLSSLVSYLDAGVTVHHHAAILNRLYGGGKPLTADTQLSHVVFEFTNRIPENIETTFQKWYSKIHENGIN